MAKMKFKITGGIPEDLSKIILEDVYELLSTVGLEIDHPDLLKELAGHDGVIIKDKRVCYTPELVESARMHIPLEDTNYATQKQGDERFLMRPPFSPFNVLDFETGRKRPAQDQDVIDGARLYDAFDVTGPVHVHLADIDQKTAQLHIAKLCCENSRGVGNWSPAFSYEQAITIRDMFLAAGRQEPYVAFQMTHSPLRLDAYFLDILMQARKSENGIRGFTAGGGAMPLPGVSSPIHYRSAAAQGLAESIGGWITAKFIDPRIKPYASFVTQPPDMSTCEWTSVVPEAILFNLLNRQIMQELLNITCYSYCGNLYKMCLEGLQGTRIFGSGGERNGCFSLAHIPIDQEKINFVKAFVSGTGFPEEIGLTTKIVQETLPQTSFLVHQSSLEYRNLFWHPEVFKGMTPPHVGEALFSNSDSLLLRAKEIVKEKLREHGFSLPDDIKKEVERIYKAGCHAVCKHSN